jgi:hypothetical protein
MEDKDLHNKISELRSKSMLLALEQENIQSELRDSKWKLVISGQEKDFTGTNCEELIYRRQEARTNKDWKLSDQIRGYLDSKFVFVFDTKDDDGNPFQETYWLCESYFNLDEVYHYPEIEEVLDKDGEIKIAYAPAWFETKREKVARLNGVKAPKSNREYVEFKIKSDIQSEKRMEAWMYSMSQSGASRTGDEYTSVKGIKDGKITINGVVYNVIEVTDLHIRAKAANESFERSFVRPDNDK